MYPAGALLVAQALQDARLRDAEVRRDRELEPRARTERPDPWGAILRVPRFGLADAKG